MWSDQAIHRFKAECTKSKTSPYVHQGFHIQNMVYEAGDNWTDWHRWVEAAIASFECKSSHFSECFHPKKKALREIIILFLFTQNLLTNNVLRNLQVSTPTEDI